LSFYRVMLCGKGRCGCLAREIPILIMFGITFSPCVAAERLRQVYAVSVSRWWRTERHDNADGSRRQSYVAYLGCNIIELLKCSDLRVCRLLLAFGFVMAVSWGEEAHDANEASASTLKLE
jgi:hypothetical protein